MSRPNTPSYKTLNWPEYNTALKRRGSLTIWFDPGVQWAALPTGERGRQPVYTDAAVQTCLTMKVLFGMALRQTTGFVESLLRLVGLDWDVSDFSTREEGDLVHYLGSTFLPAEGLCLCLYQAKDEAVLGHLNRGARLPVKRIVDAIALAQE